MAEMCYKCPKHNSLTLENERPHWAVMLIYHSIIGMTGPGEHIVDSLRSMIPVGRSCKWPVWQIGLLSAVADGTQWYQGQCSVYAPPKILILGGRIHLHLSQQISAHVGEEAAVFGGGIQFCSQEVIAQRYLLVLCLARIQFQNPKN